MGSSGGSGSGSRYLDPHRVYDLVVRLMPRELLDYLDSIPGSSRDSHCEQIKAVANRLDILLSHPLRFSKREESRRIQCWARAVRSHATSSRLCGPTVGNPFNFTSDAVHNMHPRNSNSCFGRMWTKEAGHNELKCAKMLNQLDASSSRHRAEIISPLQEKSNDGLNINPDNSCSFSGRVLTNKPTTNELRHAAMHSQLSASSRSHAAPFPVHENLNDELIRYATCLTRTPAANPSRETAHVSYPNPLPLTRNEKARMVSPSARRICAPGVISQRGGAFPPSSSKRRKTPAPAATSDLIPPRTSPTSPPRTSLTSPSQPRCRARRRLRLCQRRLTRPSEAQTSPPRRVLRSTTARHSPESWSFRQTIEMERVYFDDDGGAARRDILRGWSDDW